MNIIDYNIHKFVICVTNNFVRKFVIFFLLHFFVVILRIFFVRFVIFYTLFSEAALINAAKDSSGNPGLLLNSG